VRKDNSPTKYPRGSSAQRGYDARWRRARAEYLNRHPLCVYCQQLGRLVPASVVDHVKAHKGDRHLFWNQGNWQALCQPCHDSHKARLERGGVLRGADADGIPLDPGHHWNCPPTDG
jgi:5-methylcytosine-specific restriction protein A